jgi:CheY-like chemotaxis protein
MDRLRDLRGADTRERDLANILGFEHSRAVRWKEGQMYVDRAEYLVRLADALEVDTMLLVQLVSGSITVEQAQKMVQKAGRAADDGKKRKSGSGGSAAAPVRVADADLAADAAEFATNAAQLESAVRGVVLLAATNGEGRSDFGNVVARHSDMGGLVATSLPVALSLAERSRPELVFLDMGLANVHAFESLRVLSSLSSRAGRRCRVIAGTSNVTDGIEKPALMAGAANVALFPFAGHLFQSELDRLEERLGPRRAARRS